MNKNKNYRRKNGFSPMSAILAVLLVIYSFTIIFSIYFVLVSAFKTIQDFDKNFIGLPTEFTFSNIKTILEANIADADKFSTMKRFGKVISKMYLPTVFLNTILYSIGSAFFAALVPCLTAYFVAKYNYKFSKIMYGTVVVVLVVPIIGNLPSTYKMLHALNLYDRIIGSYITKANFVNMWFLVFYAAFKSVPNDYMEAAYIDGASEFRVMTTVMLPLVRTAFMTVVLIFFVDLWNDYQTPALFLPSHPTLAYMIRVYSGTYKKVTIEMAACTVMIVPTLLVFVIFRDKLMGNITMGGIKG